MYGEKDINMITYSQHDHHAFQQKLKHAFVTTLKTVGGVVSTEPVTLFLYLCKNVRKLLLRTCVIHKLWYMTIQINTRNYSSPS